MPSGKLAARGCSAGGRAVRAGGAAEGSGGTPALEFSHVSFSYAEGCDAEGCAGAVLDDVCLAVPQGAFALVVGATGSGKSTLLSLAKPEIAPAGARAGDVLVFGRPAGELSVAESAQTVGYVFQNPDNQIVCENVWHEMAFGLENLGFEQGEMRRRIAETSYFFGLDGWFRAETATLSGGRKQLLALASTLVMRPRLLLLDEPTSQLDPIAERSFLHALFRANRELGCTVVVATHRARAMVDYASCAYRLENGSVLPVSDMDELRELPPLLDGVGRATGAGERQAGGAPAGDVLSGERALSFRRAWFRYEHDAAWVLRSFDLDVQVGEIHALVGGNGCGKSTILDLAAGVQRVQRGACENRLRDAQALLPQDPKALLTGETVLGELMEWSGHGRGGTGPSPDDGRAAKRGRPRQGRSSRAAGAALYSERDAFAMLGRMGLSALAERHPYDISGGQQQLVALAKLLLLEPRLLLLDEPTKGLDLAARRMLAAVLADARARGVTVLMASHDLDFVRQVADRVTMVFDGEAACTEGGEQFFCGNVYYRP